MSKSVDSAQKEGEISTVEEFVAWVNQRKGQSMLYRGLADSAWKVEASAYRRIRDKGNNPAVMANKNNAVAPPQKVFNDYIGNILDSASLKGFRNTPEKRLSDLELLATLQHNGAATCLIDFTKNALTALWFACSDQFDKAGKVIAMNTDSPDDFAEVNYEDLENKIETFLGSGKQWKWTPSYLSSRVVAQQSVFVIGKVVPEKNHASAKINKDRKRQILKDLKHKYGITEEYLFSDLSGFSQANAHNKPYIYDTADDFLRRAIEYHQRSEYKKAIECYDKAIDRYDETAMASPEGAIAYYNRGLAKYVLEDFQGAIEDCSEAIRIDPQNADAYSNRGLAKYALEDFQGAIEDCSETIRIDPQNAAAYYNRGNAKYELKDFQGVIEDLNEANRIDPQDVATYNNRGNAKNALKDFRGAIEDCSEAIRIDPQHAKAYRNRGNAKNALGDKQGAEEDFRIAKEIEDQNPNQ